MVVCIIILFNKYIYIFYNYFSYSYNLLHVIGTNWYHVDWCYRWYILREQNARTGVRHDVRSSSRCVWRTYGRSSVSSCPLWRGLLGRRYSGSFGCDVSSHHRHGSGNLGHFECLYRSFLHTLWWSLLCCLYRCYSTFLHLHRLGELRMFSLIPWNMYTLLFLS